MNAKSSIQKSFTQIFLKRSHLIIQFRLLNFLNFSLHSSLLLAQDLINPNTPDRFTPSHARCTENCGSALTHRLFD